LFHDVVKEIYKYNKITLTDEQIKSTRNSFFDNIIGHLNDFNINELIYTYFKNNKIILYNKYLDLTYGLSNFEYDDIMRKHINTLEKLKFIKNDLNKSENNENILLSKLLSLILRY
jgi:chromatin remodeling complex protein RSC6